MAVVDGDPATSRSPTADRPAPSGRPRLIRLPHAPGRRRARLRRRGLHARADRALRRRRRATAASTRSGSPTTSTASAQARDWFDHPLWPGDANGRPRALPRTVAGAPRRRPAGEGGARGRLPGRARGGDRRRCGARSSGTSCSARCTGWRGLAVDWDAAPVWEHAPGRRGLADRTSTRVCAAASSGIYDVHGASRPGQGVRPPARPSRRALYERSWPTAFAAAGVCAEVSSAGYRRRWASCTRAARLLELLQPPRCPGHARLGRARARRRRPRRSSRALAELHAAGYRTLTRVRRGARASRQVPIDALNCGSASASTPTPSPTAAGWCWPASRSTIRRGPRRATPTPTSSATPSPTPCWARPAREDIGASLPVRRSGAGGRVQPRPARAGRGRAWPLPAGGS